MTKGLRHPKRPRSVFKNPTKKEEKIMKPEIREQLKF